MEKTLQLYMELTCDHTDRSVFIYNPALAMYRQTKDVYDRLTQIHDNGSLSEVKRVELGTNLKKRNSNLKLQKTRWLNATYRLPQTTDE